MKPPRHNIIGNKYGMLTVLEIADPPLGKRGYRYFCRCDCGNTKSVDGNYLIIGHTKSCGCARITNSRAKCITHGDTIGRRDTPEHMAWKKMLRRCYNKTDKSYHYYGERGIKVHDKWKSFINFLTDMGRRPSAGHSLDRIDNNGNYEPGNCRWATREQQARNKRSNRILAFNGKAQTIAEWSRELGLNYTTIYSRKLKGWSDERALSLCA